MEKNLLTDAPIYPLPGVADGTYQLDGAPVSVRDLCARALDLDRTLLKHWQLDGQPIFGVASHEAAEVLRQHGHEVGALPEHVA